MGFFDRFKKKDVPPPPPSPQDLSAPEANTGVIVLFDRSDGVVEELERTISERFGADSILEVDRSKPSITHLMLRIDGTELICSYLPFSLPPEDGDIQTLLQVNCFRSEEEERAFQGNQSFCLITEIGGGNTLEGKRSVCLLLTKLCGSLLQIQGAAGVYVPSSQLLLGKTMYLKYVSITEQEAGNPDYFPSLLWVLVYQTQAEDGTPTVETCGLAQFGFLELVFYHPREEWAQSYEKLYLMSMLQITGKEVYRNRDTISFTPDGFSIFKQNGTKLSVIGGI